MLRKIIKIIFLRERETLVLVLFLSRIPRNVTSCLEIVLIDNALQSTNQNPPIARFYIPDYRCISDCMEKGGLRPVEEQQ